jgi:hypothetical protein
MFSKLGQGIILSTLTSTNAEIVCQSDFQGTTDMGGRGENDQRLAYWVEGDGHAHLLCQGKMANGSYVQSTCEFRGGSIGFKTGWQSANPHGEVRWELTEVNGQAVSKGTIEVPSAYSKHALKSDGCGTGDGGDPFQFRDAMVVENKLGGTSATITALAFRNDGVKAEVLTNEVYSVDADMGSCKLEMMVKIPVNPNGDTTFGISIRFHKDEGEEELNQGLTAANKDGMVEISSSLDAADGSKVALVMARGLICESSKQALANEDITISDLSNFPDDNTFTYSVKQSAASSCEFLYWDPTMTPFAGGGVTVTDTDRSFGAGLAGAVAALVTAVHFG